MGVQTSLRIDGPTEVFPGYVLVPTGGKVIYVHSSGASALDQLPAGIPGNPDGFFTTLNAAFATCRDNRGDVIVCLPGHSESLASSGGTDLSNIKAGVRVVGASNGITDMPTLRWTATTAQWAISSANCTFENLRLRLEGANGVVKAINVTGAGTTFKKCRIQTGSGASNKATIAIEVGSAATEFQFDDCYMYGVTGAVTDGIKFVGATVPSNFHIRNSRFVLPATEINGIIHVTVAALDNIIEGCIFQNTVASSTACVVLDNVATTGFMVNCDMSDLNDGTATAQGVIVGGASVLWRFSRTFEVDEKAKNSILSPGVGT